ncbi:hypothetical protein H257_09950 [Aphanomyces astaci]|uniref:Uncharacterized protein n=1 Tax=Aphanomyces astaci TaxID=112090 RepID=W4GA99_APHAT|nr:hypothetical protein H257_09950 [Aphanomyces astaci]ETV75999.1 hypothetical protein H257_09950 [Aphanomyces astaci]|eukprot:XP_009834641.1 hypothetical protein H257_09950 [Aphanomyces astaci]
MTSNQSFSDLLLSSNDLDDMNNECLDQLTADVVNRSKNADAASAAKAAGLKRKPSASFQKQRSQVYEYLPEDDNPSTTATGYDYFADYKDGEATTFVTATGEQHVVGLGLDLDSLVPSSTSTLVPDPIPFKEESHPTSASPVSHIETIPDIIHLSIPSSTTPFIDGTADSAQRGGRGHVHRNSVELTGLSHQFGLQTSMAPPGSPVHQQHRIPPSNMIMPSYAPASPVNPLHMAYPTSPAHHHMQLPPAMMQPSSPVRHPANGLLMPLPISVFPSGPMNMYGYDPTMLMPHSPALSSGMSDHFGSFNMHTLSQPNSPSSHSSSSHDKNNNADSGREKREYKCRQCGQPKSGHTCTSIKSMMDSAVQNETTPSNMTDWRILPVKSKWVVA